MRTRLAIAALIFMMVQGLFFGVGMVLVLTAAPASSQQTLIPWMIVLTFLVSAPVAWIIAPRLMLRFRRDRPVEPVTGDGSTSRAP